MRLILKGLNGFNLTNVYRSFGKGKFKRGEYYDTNGKLITRNGVLLGSVWKELNQRHGKAYADNVASNIKAGNIYQNGRWRANVGDTAKVATEADAIKLAKNDPNYRQSNGRWLYKTDRGWKYFNGNPVQLNSGLITQKTGESPIGLLINPDTKQKTNYVRVNFGDTNGLNLYLKGNYWVYDDGNGNILTIGFRNNGKDYAYVNSNSDGTSSFLNTNAKGTIIKSPSIDSSRLTSYASGFTPGMSLWRGKAGWYTNVGNELPDNVAEAKNGYLYDKLGRMIGFNAAGNYYLLKNQVPTTHLGEAANTFVSGWKGLGNDLVNLYHRELTPTDMLGALGDLGRGVQHLTLGTIGAATEALLPDVITNNVGKYGLILDPGKVISGVAHGKTPWNESNHGLVDFDPGNLSLLDLNDALNGAMIIFGTKGAGSAKGAVKAVVRNSETAAKIADATTAAKAAAKVGYLGVKDVYKNGARKLFVSLPKPGELLYTKAGLRPSNIVPMGRAFKKGFQDTFKPVYNLARLNRIPENQRFTRIYSGEVITPKRPKPKSTVKNPTVLEVKAVNPESLPSVGSQNFTRIPNDLISISKPIVELPSVGPLNFIKTSSGDIISISKPKKLLPTTTKQVPETISNILNFIRTGSGPLYYAAKPEPLALPRLLPKSISWQDAVNETKRNKSSKKVNNILLPPILLIIYPKSKISINPEILSLISKKFNINRKPTPIIIEKPISLIETPKTISWKDATNAYKLSILELKKLQYLESHKTKLSKSKLLRKRKYNKL